MLKTSAFALNSFLSFFDVPYLGSEQILLTLFSKHIYNITSSHLLHNCHFDPKQHHLSPGLFWSPLLHEAAGVTPLKCTSDDISPLLKMRISPALKLKPLHWPTKLHLIGSPPLSDLLSLTLSIAPPIIKIFLLFCKLVKTTPASGPLPWLPSCKRKLFS